MHEVKRIKSASLTDFLEQMSKPVFQTVISWRVVDSKWPEIKEAFQGFDPAVVSKFSLSKIDQLVQDARVIRNRRKIEAIVGNARRMMELDQQYGGFRKYLRSFGSYEELTADLRRQFKFLGEMGAYHFLYVVGEKVPSWEEWSAAHEISRP